MGLKVELAMEEQIFVGNLFQRMGHKLIRSYHSNDRSVNKKHFFFFNYQRKNMANI